MAALSALHIRQQVPLLTRMATCANHKMAAAQAHRQAYYADPARLPEYLKYYLPHAFPADFQEHHLVELQCLQIRGRLVVLILPRGFGKTAIADGYTIYNVHYGLEPYIVRFEHDLNTGQRQIMNLVKAFTDNPQIMADSQVTPGKIWRPQRGELSFVNKNPYAKHKQIFVRYVGVQSIARGTTYDFSRISLAIFNDVVKGMSEAVSHSWNSKVRDIVKIDVGMGGAAHTTGNAISTVFISTIQATGDVTDQLRGDPFAMVYQVPALLGDESLIKEFVEFVSGDIPNLKAFITNMEGTPPRLTGYRTTSDDHRRYCEQTPGYAEYFAQMTSTWPEVFPLWDYVFEIAAYGGNAFLQERQHITGDVAFRKFLPEWFLEYDALPPGEYVYGMGIDTSGEPREGTDPMAIVAGAYETQTGQFYVLEAWCAQATPDELVAAAHEIHYRQFVQQGRRAIVYLEAIVSATGMGKAMFAARAEAQRGVSEEQIWQAQWQALDVQEIKPTVKKEVRLMAMRPVCEQRRIHVQRQQPAQALLITQVCNWKGQSTHKILPIEFKIDTFDALTLCFMQCAKQSRTPVILAAPQANRGRSLFHAARNPFAAV